ncbi:MAG: SAM-dependent methyltransferase [Kiritimatiellia bacterium]|jgi:SAM-dependent methyltransferase
MSVTMEKDTESLGDFYALMTMNGGARVFGQACSSGLLKALSLKAATVEELARRCELAERPVDLLLRVLVDLGVVICKGEAYALSPLMHMISQGYGDLGNAYWTHLESWMQTGTPFKTMDRIEESEQHYVHQATALGWMMQPSAQALAAEINRQTQGHIDDVLDMGAGSGVWSLSLSATLPQVKVTLQDWPGVLQLALAQAQQLGLARRVKMLPGDLLEVTFPEHAFDLIMIANVTHLFSEELNVQLFRRCAEALRPGGQLVVVDVMPGDPRGDLSRSLYELGLALRTAHGRVHAPERLTANLREAGLHASTVYAIPATPYTMGALFAGPLV